MSNESSLKKISEWAVGADCDEGKGVDISVSIPVFQRGLVWGAQQTEFLWDSILRGFPVGSFVTCKAITKQQKSEPSEYHLLDGQQRAHAIALGFAEPTFNQSDLDDPAPIIWMDLAPKERIKDTTREFLIRLATPSHPWGYRANEDSGVLSARNIREQIPKDNNQDKNKRLKPADIYPFDAVCPVPLSWLLSLCEEKKEDFWEKLSKRLREESSPWSKRCVGEIEAENVDFDRIYSAISRTKEFSIPILKIPDEEDCNDDISDVEVLFQRLNRQGSPLQGEELFYSMIKASWPEVQKAVGNVAKCRVPSSRIVNLGVRLAITKPNDINLHRGLTISALRKMKVSSAEADQEGKHLLEDFLIKENGEKLSSVVFEVEKWLRGEPERTLPFVLVSSIARDGKGDLYLLFLYWAYRDTPVESEVLTSLPGLATFIHWFGNDKRKIVDAIFNECRESVSMDGIRRALAKSIENKWLVPLFSTTDFELGLKKYSDVDQRYADKQWRWNCFLDDEQLQKDRDEVWWPFVSRVVWNRELLLYAQRKFIEKAFWDYDPADKELWKEHNRPWDFDHIHPSACFYNRRGEYRSFTKEWGNTIGNLRAWPFEKNRSDQKDPLDEKLPDIKDDRRNELVDSFICEDEVIGFSHADSALKDADKALSFMNSTLSRLVRIYGEWLESSGAKEFLDKTGSFGQIFGEE